MSAKPLIAVALAIGLLGMPSGAQAARLLPAPAVHRDPTDFDAGRLDLRTAELLQRGTRFTLRISTAHRWNASALSVARQRSLCIVLIYGTPARPRSQLCVSHRHAAPVLVRGQLDRQRRPTGPSERQLTDAIVDHSGRVLRASFSPQDVTLPYGPFRWFVRSRWRNHADCTPAGPCSDRIPAQGTIQARAALLVEPRCFGAASRDPDHPCDNPLLADRVLPTPENALITPNAFCLPQNSIGLIHPCQFGVGPHRALETIALIGDSHASHWRGGVEVAAQALRWRGLSVTRSSCPFSFMVPRNGTTAKRRRCTTWSHDVIDWLDRHPEVHTVLTSDHAQAKYTAGAVDGFVAADAAIPPSVTHIIVLRDDSTLKDLPTTCLDHLLAVRSPIGDLCSAPRAKVLFTDAAALAAAASPDPRLDVIDLTSSMCSDTLCYAVVGGALVHKDTSHLTSTFSTTLGPLLLRQLRAMDLT